MLVLRQVAATAPLDVELSVRAAVEPLLKCACTVIRRRLEPTPPLSIGSSRSGCECRTRMPYVVGSGAHGFACVVLVPWTCFPCKVPPPSGARALAIAKVASGLGNTGGEVSARSGGDRASHYKRCFDNESAVLRLLCGTPGCCLCLSAAAAFSPWQRLACTSSAVLM